MKKILNTIGKIAKKSLKYIPIGWTIHDFTRNDLYLYDPWQQFKFGLRSAITFGLIVSLPLGIYKFSSKEHATSVNEIYKENNERIFTNIYSLGN